MYLRSVRSFALIFSLTTLAAGGAAHAFESASLIDAKLSEGLGVRSYVYDADVDRPTDDVWGLGVDWAPGDGLTTSLDFSVLSVDEAQDNNLQQFLHLGLGHQGQHISFGAKYYSVTDGYVSSALGQQLLMQKGIYGAGDGSEVWLRLKAGKLQVQPVMRHTVQEYGGAVVTNRHYNVATEYPLFESTRVRLDVGQHRQEWLGQGPGTQQDRVGVQLSNSRWDVSVNRVQEAARATQNATATLRIGKRWSLRPMHLRTRGSQEDRRFTAIALDVLKPRLPLDHMNVNVSHDQHETFNQSVRTSELRVAGSRRLEWRGAFAPTTLLTGSLLFRHRDTGFGTGSNAEFGVNFTVTHTFGA